MQRVDRTSDSLASFTPVPVSLAYAVEFTARISEQQFCVKWSSDSFSQSFLCTSHEGHMLQDVCHSSSLYESSGPQWRYSDRCICSQKVLLIHQPPSKAVCFHSRNYPGLTLYGKGVHAPLNRKFTSLAYCCEFCIPCDFSQGTTAAGTVLTDVIRCLLW